MYDPLSPAQGHGALTDVDTIRANTNALRTQESDNPSTAPPTNPSPFMLWTPSDTKNTYQRNGANTQWLYRWGETNPPVAWSDFNIHTNTPITSTISAHGIMQGPGNGFNADTVDGNHASDLVPAAHAWAVTGVHGVSGNVVGTGNSQNLYNKYLDSSNYVQWGALPNGGCWAADKIAARSIVGWQIAAGQITSYEMAAGAALANIVANSVDGSRISHNVVSSGSQALNEGQAWTPAAGVYNFAADATSGNSAMGLQIYVGGGWKGSDSGNNGAVLSVNGLVLCDGSNMRLLCGYSINYGGAVYYQKF